MGNTISNLYGNKNLNNNTSNYNLCQDYMQTIQTWSNITFWTSIVLVIIFLLCIFAHAKVTSARCDSEKKANMFFQIGNVIFYLFLLIFVIGMLINIFYSWAVGQWINNPYNKNIFTTNCVNIMNAIQQSSGNSGSANAPLVPFLGMHNGGIGGPTGTSGTAGNSPNQPLNNPPPPPSQAAK